MMQLFLRRRHAEEAWSAGGAQYLPDYPEKLLIGIKCRFGPLTDEHMALLDTGATWSICKKEVADLMGLKAEDSLGYRTLSTRFGSIEGFLDRCEITLVSESGEDLHVEATLFISENWPGPHVIGWKGCLERIRFALDPKSEVIFYGSY